MFIQRDLFCFQELQQNVLSNFCKIYNTIKCISKYYYTAFQECSFKLCITRTKGKLNFSYQHTHIRFCHIQKMKMLFSKRFESVRNQIALHLVCVPFKH